MTGDEATSMVHIEKCRRVNRLAANKYAEQGVSLEDIAIAAMYSAFDLALALKGNPSAAIEWARTAFDVMERGLLEEVTVQ